MNAAERRAPKRWSEEEDKILYDEARKQSATENIKDWHKIASKLPGRTNRDCRKRWVNKVRGSLKKGAWDEDEDIRLLRSVEKHGQKWTLIANDVGFRSPDQCAKRWQHNLDPKLEHGQWTAAEDYTLLESVQEYGREWKLIQEKSYPSRSRNDLKNRYTILSRRRNTSDNENSFVSHDVRSAIVPGCSSIDADMENAEDTADIDELETSDHDSSESWIDSVDTHWLSPFELVCGSPANTFLSQRDTHATFSSKPSELSSTVDANLINPPMNFLDQISLPADLSQSSNDVFHTESTWPENSETGISNSAASSSVSSQFGQSTALLRNLQGDSLDYFPVSKVMDGVAVGRVSITMEQCDRATLDYLLDMTSPLRGKVRLEISL
ncbi:hypothetical protein F5Y19DRAFT_35072 [Xylariaceae sp. FL1651]|nr:hypothetical protein F5Y19DRAFT_35072 [Xylariaceae sp. FL1651]